MRSRFVRWATYGSAMCLMAAGLALFTAAEAGASGLPSGVGALHCDVTFSYAVGTTPTTGDTYTMHCTWLGEDSTGHDYSEIQGQVAWGTKDLVVTLFNVIFDSSGTLTCTGPAWADFDGNGCQTGGLVDTFQNLISNPPGPYGPVTTIEGYNNGDLTVNYDGGGGNNWVGSISGGGGSGGSGSPPCTLNSVYGYNSANNAVFGTSDHVYVLNTSGDVSAVMVSSSADPAFVSGQTPADYYASYDTHGTPGTLPYVFVFGAPSGSPGTTTWNADLNFSESTAPFSLWGNPRLTAWCYAAGSGWFDWGDLTTISSAPGEAAPGSGPVPVEPYSGPGQSAFDVGTCLSSDGLGLNPASWVPGLWSMGTCVIKYLVVPSTCSPTAPCSDGTTTSAWNSLVTAFGISSSTPTVGASSASQWLGSGAYLLAAGPYESMVQIQSAESAGGCSLLDGSGYQLGTHHFSVCDALAAVSDSSASIGAWGYIKPVLSAAFLVMFFLALIALLRKLLGSGV